ncbi:MAG TPA: glycerate kinase [Candidatus Thioglobus sp.]|nr:glycerate kinase [Candidatus Thioglobus sp.]
MSDKVNQYDAQMVAELDTNLAHYAKIIHQTTGKDVASVPSAGAAGGLGAAFLAFLSTELKSGIDIVLDAVDLERHLEGADLLITGEGRIDSQSLHGKAPIGIAKRAKKYQCAVFVIAGSVEGGIGSIHEQGIDRVFSVVSETISLAEALEQPFESLALVSSNVAKQWLKEQ